MASSSKRKSKKPKTDIPIVEPVVRTKPLTRREQALSFENTASEEAKLAHKEYFGRSQVWLERGIEFSKVGKEVKAIFLDRGWMEIAKDRTEEINISMVSEFYSVLSTYDADTVEEMTYIPLRKKNVTFYPSMINVFYGLLDIPEDEDYRNVWGLEHPMALQTKAYEAQQAFDPQAEWFENRFRYGNCIRDIRAIKQFIGHNVCPSTHVCAFGHDEVVVAWAMVRDVPVDLGRLIFTKACEFANSRYRGGRLPFPSLISALCQNADVPVLSDDKLVSPHIPRIGLKLKALPTGIIDYNNPNRQPQQQQVPPPPPRVPRPPRQSPQPQQTQNSQVEAMFQHLVQAQARTDANIALSCEKNRQWAEDNRLAQQGFRDAMCEFDPRFAEISSRYQSYQPDPYTMPDWIPPTPPPVIFQDYTSSTLGQGGMFSGTPSMGMGGFTSVADVTAGFGSFGLQGSVSTSTMRAETSFHASAAMDPQQFSFGVHTTHTGGSDYTSMLSAGVSTYRGSSSDYDPTDDIDFDYDEED